METSVQELICESLLGAVKADGMTVWFVEISISKRYLVLDKCLGNELSGSIQFFD